MGKTNLSLCYGIAEAIEKEAIALFGYPYVEIGYSRRKSGNYSFAVWSKNRHDAKGDQRLVYHSEVNELSMAFVHFQSFLTDNRVKQLELDCYSKSTKGNKINFSDYFWDIEECQQRAGILLKSWYSSIKMWKTESGFYAFDITGPKKNGKNNSIHFKSKKKTLGKALDSLVIFLGEEINK